MKKALFIIFIFLSVYSCKSQNQSSVWTAEYEAKWYRQIDDGVKLRLPDDDKRKDLVSYIVKRLKSELPKGIESIPADSLNRLSSKIGAEYGSAHPYGNSGLIPHFAKWTPLLEKALRDEFLKDASPKELESEKKACDCIMVELKKIYPDSVLTPIPRDILFKVASKCFDEIK